MATNRKFVQGQDYFLAGSGITLSATTIVLTSMYYPDNATKVVTADIGALAFATLEPETSREENISFTGITQNANGTATLTGVTRGLNFKSPYTADASLRLAHAGGVTLRIANSVPFYNNFANKENDETVSQTWTFTNPKYPRMDAAAPLPVDPEELATKAYVDSVAIAGAPDADLVTKGIVQIATDAQLAAGTNIGTTGARVVASGANHNQTPAATKVPVSKANNQLAGGWLGLTAAGQLAYFDGTDWVALNPTTLRYLRMNGTTPEWGGANLDEADTFFGITSITGAQANTLIGGVTSNADTLHSHAKPAFFSIGLADSDNTDESYQIATDPSATYLYLLVAYNTPNPNIAKLIVRFTRDANTGNYYYDGNNATLNQGVYGFQTEKDGGLTVGTQYVWVAAQNGVANDVTVIRLNLDLTAPLAMTMAGGAQNIEVQSLAGNDSVLYVKDGSGNTKVWPYTIAGNTATKGASFNVGDNNTPGFYFTGTHLLYGKFNTILKYSLAGVLTSTTYYGVVYGAGDKTDPRGSLFGIGYRDSGTIWLLAMVYVDDAGGQNGYFLNGYAVTKL